MSAFESLTDFSNSLKNEIPTPELNEKIKDLKDSDILSDEEIKECAGVCKAFGLDYPGKSFQIFTTKNNEYSVVLPRCYSTGKAAVLEWGDVVHTLTGAKPNTKFRNIGTTSGFFFKKFSDFFVRVELKPDDKPGGGDRTYLNSISMFDDEDCLTWEQSLPCMLVKAPKADRQILIDAGGFTIVTCEKIKGKPREDGKDSFYWSANVLAADNPYMAFLPGDVDFQAGDVVVVQDKKFVLKRTGIEFNLGLNFEKLNKLAIGEHLVTGIEIAKGEFGGYNLVLGDGRIVTANQKIKDWISCLGAIESVTPENPAILTVGASNTLKNGKTQTQVFMRLKNAVGFLSKLKREPSDNANMSKPPLVEDDNAGPTPPVIESESKPKIKPNEVTTDGVAIKNPWL